MAPASAMEQTLRVARRVAREAALLRRRCSRPRTVERKSSAIDLVTGADRASERLIVPRLRRAFPHHAILAEEQRCCRSPRPEFESIVDPLDGTTNWVHRFPRFAVAIALRKREQVQIGVVYDPLRRELFTAAGGRGAWLNGRPIQVSAIRDLGNPLLASGFPYDCQRKAQFYLAFVRAFLEAQPRPSPHWLGGPGALLPAWLGGRLDGFWESHPRRWDTAAAGLIVQEAGNCLSDFLGTLHDEFGNQALAANPFIHRQMLEVFRKMSRGLQRSRGIVRR